MQVTMSATRMPSVRTQTVATRAVVLTVTQEMERRTAQVCACERPTDCSICAYVESLTSSLQRVIFAADFVFDGGERKSN